MIKNSVSNGVAAFYAVFALQTRLFIALSQLTFAKALKKVLSETDVSSKTFYGGSMFNTILNRCALVLQHDEFDCAPACLASICKYYGKRIPLTTIRRFAGTDKDGTSGFGIIRGAEELGFLCKGGVSPDKSFSPNMVYPLIAHIKQNNFDHYVVVYSCKNGRLHIGDPAYGVTKMKADDFKTLWTGIFFIVLPQEKFETNKDTDTKLTRFIKLLAPHKKLLAEVFTASVLLSFLGIASAFYFRFLIDEVLYTGVRMTLTLFSLAYALIIVFQSLLLFSRSQLMMYMGSKIDAVLMTEYFRHILKLPMDFFTARKTGEILSRINDTATIRYAISSASLSVVLDSLMLVIGGTFLFVFGGKLLVAAVIPVCLSALLAWLFFGPYKNMLKTKAVIDADKQSVMVENINGIATLKTLSCEKTAFERTEMRIVDSIKKGISLGTMGNIENGLHGFLHQCGTLAVYWIGSLSILSGTMSLGRLISFVLLSGYFLGPLARLLTLQPSLQEAFVAAVRLAEILDIPEENINSGGIKKDDVRGSIRINNLSFAYGTRGNTLENINLSIEPGQKVAFVGASGSGKTTLAKLLMKFYACNSGEITVDGINIQDYDTISYRKLIGYVPQDVLLFSGTIKDNIRLGLEYLPDEAVYEAARAAMADEFISKLPDRYDTFVGERGATLSGGERQRIALARVLLRRPRILILDEATASLDSVTERAIMQTVDKLACGITTVIIAHRLSTIVNCDRVFVFDSGRLVESGPHGKLLRSGGAYKKLWRAQRSGASVQRASFYA